VVHFPPGVTAALIVGLYMLLRPFVVRAVAARPDAPNPGAVLDRIVPEIHVTELGAALDAMAAATGTPITADWAALAPDGVTRQTPVELHLKQVELGDAMEVTLAQVPTPPLAYEVNPAGRITVMTRAAMAKNPVVRTYDVQDLLDRADAFSKNFRPTAEEAQYLSKTPEGRKILAAPPPSPPTSRSSPCSRPSWTPTVGPPRPARAPPRSTAGPGASSSSSPPKTSG